MQEVYDQSYPSGYQISSMHIVLLNSILQKCRSLWIELRSQGSLPSGGGDNGVAPSCSEAKSKASHIYSVHPHRISLTTLRSEGLIVQHQPMLMIKRPADHDKVNPQKATTAHMWTTTLLQATQRSARHRETWTKTETSWVHPSHNKNETCTQTPVSNPTGGRWGRRWKVKQEMLRKLSWNHTTTRGP